MSTWTDELKEEVIEQYTSQDPTPETTMEIVEGIAEEHGLTVNGVRMVLSKAGEYVAKGKTASASTEGKTKKKPKQESLDDLTTILKDNSVEVDDTVISKLTGKAAEFFIGAFKTVTAD